MRFKVLLLILVASVAGNIAFAVTSVTARPVRSPTPVDRLGLTESQRADLARLQERFAGERARARARVQELTGQYADQFAQASPDRARVQELAGEMATIQTEMRLKFMGFLLDLHALLQAEQRSLLSDIIRNGEGPGTTAPCCPGAALCPSPAGDGGH